MKLKILFSFLIITFLLSFQVNAQSVPTLTAPVNGSTWDTTTPTLYWYYYTSTSVSYTVQLSTDSGFGSFIINTTVSGGSTANFAVSSSYGLAAGTTYHWRVSADGGSNWSTTSNFTPSSGYGGGTYTGGVPTLTAPVNGSTWDTTTPTLYWYYYTSTTVSYTVQLSIASDFSSTIINTSVSGSSTANYPVPALASLLTGTTYYWRVSADGGSNWSTTSSFTPASGTTTTSAVALSAPVNGSTWETTSPTLYWWGGTAPYTIYLALDSGFTSGLFTDVTGSNNYALSGLVAGMTYYWKVSDASGESSTWSFTVTGSLPTYTITATAGANGSISPSGAVTVTHGASQTFTISADPNYAVDDVDVDAGSVGAVTTYTFTNVTADHTIDATFILSPDYDWYVDAANSPTGDGSYGDPFETIQEAIDAASTGDEIFVFDGSYSETLTIDEEVLIYGTGCSTVTLTGSHTISANNVEIYGINFVTAGTAVVIDASASTIDNIDITYCCFDLPSPGVGVYIGGGSPAYKVSDINISYNEFNGPGDMISNPIKVGGAFGAPIGLELETLVFSYNTVEYGSIPLNLYDENLDDLYFGYNTFTNTDGALYVWNTTTPPTGIISDFVFEYNSIDATNSYGVALGIPTLTNFTDANFGTGIEFSNNSFVGVVGAYGIGALTVEGATTFILDAEDNWWGSANGPTHSGNTFNVGSQGSPVSDNVDYVTWLDAASGGSSFAPVVTNNMTANPKMGERITEAIGVYYFASIQAGIDAADPNKLVTAAAGTFTEDLVITTDGLDISGAGAGSTIIKGVDVEATGNYPLADPNIDLQADDVKIHDFTIETPDVGDGEYSSGIVFTGENLEFYDNIFHAVSTSTASMVEGDGYSVILQSYSSAVIGTSDISGLKIYNNVFSFTELTPVGGGIPWYEGIWINPHIGSGAIEITGNTLTGNCRRGIAVQTSNTLISNNDISTDIATTNRGIWVLVGSDHQVDYNIVSGFTKGIELGATWAGPLGDDIVLEYNTFTSNSYGVYVSDDFSIATPTTPPVINYNNISGNTTAGIDVSSADGAVGYSYLDAKNNYWGSTSGPEDNTFYDSGQDAGTPAELTAGSASAIKLWVNQTDESGSNPLGNSVEDNSTVDAAAGGFFVEYYPWDSGSASLAIEDETTYTGATFGVAVNANFYGSSADYTMQGKFYYNTAKLNFLNGTYSTGLIHDQLWTVVFYEVTPGIIDFIGYGISPLTNSGELFNLNFTVIDTIADTAQVVGNNAQFTADGSQLFGASGSFYGTVTYTVPAGTSTVLGDANLDFAVDLDDITLIALHIADPVTYPFTAQQTTNADVDTDADVDADDIAAIVYYIIYGSWPPVAPPAPSPSVVTINEATYEAEFLFLPVSLSDAENVRSLEMVMNYDENELDYQSFRESVSSSDYFVDVMKISDGIAKLTFASADGDNQITPAEIVMKKNVSELTSAITTSIKINGGDAEAGPSYYFSITDIEDPDEGMPTEFSVDQNYPNPFNPTTTIRINLPETSFVSAKVYDMLGREVRSLLNDELNAGTHSIQWYSEDNYGRKVSSGAYIYRVIAGSNVVTKKMLLIK